MHIVERYTHPDAVTLQVSMTLTDPKNYTKPWSGQKALKMELPKALRYSTRLLRCPRRKKVLTNASEIRAGKSRGLRAEPNSRNTIFNSCPGCT